jgi:predicted secreted protein
MSGTSARDRAWLLRRLIGDLLDDANTGRVDLQVNAERIAKVANELCEVEDEIALAGALSP